jgi:SAM-dependent methyltransferase
MPRGAWLLSLPGPAMSAPTPSVLDACCGSRMFWFDRSDPRALFVDKRRETCHADTREGRREIVVNPDILADFTQLPFPDCAFALVVFDPPHTSAGPNSWTRKKYGSLSPEWRGDISRGFAECFRVLAPLGTLIFKWNEHRIPVSTVLQLTPEKPLFGQRCGTTARTHWIVFQKPQAGGFHP